MKIRFILVFHFAIGCIFNLMSQGEIEFETTIYVRDTHGNEDSLKVGYASGLTKYFNPDLGELKDTSALDSVLDIRGVVFDYYDFNKFVCFTKKLINNAHSPEQFNGTTCYTTIERMYLAIYSKYQPVTIYWNRDDWNQECLMGSWITTQALTETAIFWYEGLLDTSSYKCMLEGNSVTWKLPDRHSRYSQAWFYSKWYRVHPVEGGGMDTIPFVQIAPKHRLFFDTPCRYSSTDDEIPASHSMTIYPNPTDEVIYFPDTEPSATVRIYDIFGRIRKETQGSEADVSGLPPGIYTVTAEQSGSVKKGRFVKR